MVGIIALLADLMAGIIGTFLEFQYWGIDGFTPDVVLSYVALIPQTLIITAYLVLAKEIAARGLWKSAAGLLSSYLLLCVLDVAMLEDFPAGVHIAAVTTVAIGMAGLVAFSESDIPRFHKNPVSEPPSSASNANDGSSDGPGWITWTVVIVLLVGLRLGFRRYLRHRFDLDGWLVLELVLVGLFGVAFAIWFAVAKIRLRDTLGRMAGMTGVVEIIILLIHVALLAVVGATLFTAVGSDVTNEAMETLFDSWFQPLTVITALCHAIWVGVTVAFFVSVWRKSIPTA